MASQNKAYKNKIQHLETELKNARYTINVLETSLSEKMDLLSQTALLIEEKNKEIEALQKSSPTHV